MVYCVHMAKTRQVSFRLPEDEYARLAAVHERAKERTLGYAPFGDVVREALGLISLNVITEQERDYISGKIINLPIQAGNERRQEGQRYQSDLLDIPEPERPRKRKSKLLKGRRPM